MPKTRWLKINPLRPEPKKIEEVVRVLKKGGVVAFPTETVYGLAALAERKRAVKRIYQLKKRPGFKKLTIQVAKIKDIIDLVSEISNEAKILLSEFCPGPITLILKAKRGTVGVRIPRHKISLAILRKINRSLVVTSANVSGQKDPRDAKKVKENFDGKIELIVDGEKKLSGKASTVIDLTKKKWRIIRAGEITEKKIKKALAKES